MDDLIGDFLLHHEFFLHHRVLGFFIVAGLLTLGVIAVLVFLEVLAMFLKQHSDFVDKWGILLFVVCAALGCLWGFVALIKFFWVHS